MRCGVVSSRSCNGCRCGRFRQSLGGRVCCCDEGAARVAETGWVERRGRGAGQRVAESCRPETGGRGVVVVGRRWTRMRRGGGVGGRAAVVSERSSSEMAGQQLPSASATKRLPPALLQLVPLSSTGSSVVELCCATVSQRQADHLRFE
jgi:hypothetical protein